MLVCPSSGELLGAHIIGSSVTEMMAPYSVSMQLEALDLDVADPALHTLLFRDNTRSYTLP